MKNLKNLPPSDDEYWEGAEIHHPTPVKIDVCETHFKNWAKHKGYIDNGDGTISCKHCIWGCRLPGYMRVYKEGIVDLRKL